MLEILLVIAISKKIAAVLKEKGRSATGYVMLFCVLWFGGEIFGFVVGLVLSNAANPNAMHDGFDWMAYLMALVGAAIGGTIGYAVAVAVPAIEKPYRPRYDDEYDDRDEDHDEDRPRRLRRRETGEGSFKDRSIRRKATDDGSFEDRTDRN